MKCCSAIKILRLNKGLSMRKMAEELNIPVSSYSGYEKGETDITSSNLIKIARYHNVTVDYLLGLTNISSTSLLGKAIDFKEIDKIPELLNKQTKEVAKLSIKASKENISKEFLIQLNEYLEDNLNLIDKVEKCFKFCQKEESRI